MSFPNERTDQRQIPTVGGSRKDNPTTGVSASAHGEGQMPGLLAGGGDEMPLLTARGFGKGAGAEKAWVHGEIRLQDEKDGEGL